MGSGRGWLVGNWPSTGRVLNITAAAPTAGSQWWRSGDIRRTQNVSEYMLVLALCLVDNSECSISFTALASLSQTRTRVSRTSLTNLVLYSL